MRVVYIFGILFFIIGAVFVAAHFFSSTSTSAVNPLGPSSGSSTATTNTPVTVASTPAREAPPGFREYRNAHYHVSFFYPAELSIKEFSEGADAITITFQNIQSAEGFQIFIVPYNDLQVTPARFKQDEPSGIRNKVTSGTIDRAPASAFYSKNVALGDTREVWFVRYQYLYEITTLASLDTWLDRILGTWKFF